MSPKIMLTVLLMGILTAASGQQQVTIRIPSPEEEVDYIWQNLQSIQFFEQNRYEVVWPDLALIDHLKARSRANALTDTDYQKLKQQFLDSIYSSAHYQEGFRKVEKSLPRLHQAIKTIEGLKLDWEFMIYDPYTVRLTLYGPGGSYDPETGTITLFSTRSGEFKQYTDPGCTIIHEIVHIGIEESLVTRYAVPHTMKERIVDRFVALNFKELFPEYRLQDMGDYRADQFMGTKEDLKSLNTSINQALDE